MCGLIEGWAGGSGEQRGVDVGKRVGAFVAAPSEEQEHLGKASSTQREAGCKTVDPGIGPQVPTLQTNFAFVRHDGKPERPPNGVLQALAKEHDIGSAKTKILITAERRIAIDVHAAECRLKIEGDDIAAGRHGSRKEKTQSHTSLTVAGDRRASRVTWIGGQGAVVRSVGVIVSGRQIARCFLVQRKLMVQIGAQSLEGKRGISWSEKLLIGKAVVQAEEIVEIHPPNPNAF